MKKNRVSVGTSVLAVAVAMAGILLGLGGCAAATAKPADSVQAAQSVDKARLTGYASATVSGGSSGPVSVALVGKCALLTAVRRLLPATARATKQTTPPDCVS
jgi:hypothetical protein